MKIITNNKLIVLVLVTVLGVAAWWGLSSGTSAPLLAQSGGHGEDQAFVETLLTLNSISLSGTLLKDSAFAGLRDFGVEIVQEPSGRPNPFAPLAGSMPIVQATTTSQAAPAPKKPGIRPAAQ